MFALVKPSAATLIRVAFRSFESCNIRKGIPLLGYPFSCLWATKKIFWEKGLWDLNLTDYILDTSS